MNRKVIVQNFDDINASTKRKIHKSTNSSRNEIISSDGKSNKSKKAKIYKSDSFKVNNNNIKEKLEINKLEGMDDDTVKTNNKDIKRKIFQN